MTGLLYPYQEEGVNFLTRRKTALLADDMGLGKTVQIITAADRLYTESMLIICPATVKLNWEREILKWSKFEQFIDVTFGSKHIVDPNCNIVITNYDLLRYGDLFDQLASRHYEMIVCDEAHYLKNTDTMRTLKVLGKKGLVHNADRFYLCTGTPVLNRPVELYGILKVLFPRAISKYLKFKDFAFRYCNSYVDEKRDEIIARGASNVEELAEAIRPFYLRRSKDEVLKDLPEITVQYIPLEFTATIEQALDELSELNIYSDNEELGYMATTRRRIAETKLVQCIEYIHELLVMKEKLVLFAYHKNVIDELQKCFKTSGASVVSGKVSPKNKQKAIDDFVNGPNKIFIGQISSVQGIDGLQHVCDTAVAVEISWVPGENWQAWDRIRRIGQKYPVFIHVPFVPGTLEEDMLSACGKKQNVIDRLIVDTKVKEGENTEMACIETNLEKLVIAVNSLTEVLAVAHGIAIPDGSAKPAAKPKAAAKPAAAPAAVVAPVAAAPAGVTADDLKDVTAELMNNTPEANRPVMMNGITATIQAHGAQKIDGIPAANLAACKVALEALAAAPVPAAGGITNDF